MILRPLPQLSILDKSKTESHGHLHTAPARPSHRGPSPEPKRHPSKRAKHNRSLSECGTSDVTFYERDTRSKNSARSQSRGPGRKPMLQSSSNPIDTEKDLVIELMRLYFIHIGTSGAYATIPETAFMAWLTNQRLHKSPDDIMIICAMLAMGTVFSHSPKHKERGKAFAATARAACDQRRYSLQLVQSRLILSLYYHANGSQTDCWEFAGAALRAATGMRLNLEIDKNEEIDPDELPYQLTQAGYAECRRRTFWACYIFDRFSGFCNGVPSVLSAEDVFLRLPCDEKSFEEQAEANSPYFDHSVQIYGRLETIGSLAYMIIIASIWGEITANIYRSSQRPEDTQEDCAKYIAHYNNTVAHLEHWRSSLPEKLVYSSENLTNAANEGDLPTFITIHSLYHSAYMKLNRHVRPGSIPSEQLQHNIRSASSHAEALLLLADDLDARASVQHPNETSSNETPVPYSSPFIGYAIVSAIDILTAKGYVSSLPLFPSKTRGAMAVITELGMFWEDSKAQKELLLGRRADLVAGKGFFGESTFAVMKDGSHRDRPGEEDGAGLRTEWNRTGAGLGLFEMKTAMEQGFSPDHDCFYTISIEDWEKAFGKKDA